MFSSAAHFIEIEHFKLVIILYEITIEAIPNEILVNELTVSLRKSCIVKKTLSA